MRFLFLQFPLEPAWGGAEEQTLLLAMGLAKAENEIQLVSSNREMIAVFQKSGFKAKYCWLGWEPTSAKALLLFPITAVWALVLFSYYIVSFMPGTLVCLSLSDKLTATILAKFFSVKVIWVEHTRLGRWFYQNPLLPLYRLLARLVRIVVPSYFSRNQLIAAGVPIEKIKVIYPGVEIPKNPSAGSPPNFTLGFLGRLTGEKGVEILLKSLVKLPADIHLLIAGSGPLQPRLLEQSRALNLSDRVKFLGRITEKSKFFSQIDILVVPSTLAESFGLAAAEAMSYGIPVVASRIGALPEIIEHEKTGLLFNPGDIGTLVNNVMQLRDNKETIKKVAENASRAVSIRFSHERLVEEFLNLTSSL